MLRLTVGLTVDSQPLNLTILTLSNHQLRKVSNKVRTVTKISFKIENKYLFEVWHQIMMALEQ